MKIVIIEDELLTAKDLAGCITKAAPAADIIAILSSVKEAIRFFKENPEPDLIFSDIQLGDGLSFEIFEAVGMHTPVIFCTAYDEYALIAFKAAGIDYLLKPFSVKTIAAALTKYSELKDHFSKNTQQTTFGSLMEGMAKQKQNSILVIFKDKIIPIKFADIAFFYIHNEITYLLTFDKQQYFINNTLEDIERIMPVEFYRVSRQQIINRKIVKDISQYFGRKLLINLSIPFQEKITVSKAKTNHFLAWLSAL